MARPERHRWIRFLHEVEEELRRVAWPSRKEVITYTAVVVLTVGVLGVRVRP